METDTGYLVWAGKHLSRRGYPSHHDDVIYIQSYVIAPYSPEKKPGVQCTIYTRDYWIVTRQILLMDVRGEMAFYLIYIQIL